MQSLEKRTLVPAVSIYKSGHLAPAVSMDKSGHITPGVYGLKNEE